MTCPPILASASSHCESRINSLVSKINDEKVVNDPMNPTNMIIRILLEINSRSSASGQIKPKQKHPMMLTTNVPKGKLPPVIRYTSPLKV